MSKELNIDKTTFVTFYSFKGGVGRSMALVNVAGIMAGRGFRVLALDMDLEAPGISYLMRQGPESRPDQVAGFIDLLNDACDRGEEADLFALEPAEVVKRYSYVYPLPDEIRQKEDGVLRIMPAGKLDADYQARLDSLALGQLYREGRGQPLLAAFKEVVTRAGEFDFVFIDSRTGFSDESGICTRDLADYLVVIMGLNRQNEAGTAEFLRSLRASSATPKGLRVVLSPVPNGEDDLVEEREKKAAKALSEAYGEEIQLTLQIPYHPRLALTEEPHIFRRSRGYLYEAYASIERAVLTMLGLTAGALRRELQQAAENKRVDLILHLLARMERVPGGLQAMAGFAAHELDQILFTQDAGELRLYFAGVLPSDSWVLVHLASKLHDRKSPDAALFYERLVDTEMSDSDTLGNYANFLTDVKGDHQAAEAMYKRALEADPKHAVHPGNYAVFLKNVKGDHQAAEAMYQRALEADPKHAGNLGNYANFLMDVKGDHQAAEAMYKRTLEADPNNANTLGNYAKMLFIVGRENDAERELRKAVDLAPAEQPLLAELYFYEYAHAHLEFPEALTQLKQVLVAGGCSKGWKLTENVRVAIAAGHPEPEFLTALAEVVSGNRAADSLEGFAAWKGA